MASIFISYAHEDQAAAKRIVDALAREGLDAWWDHEIPPGRSWDEIIGARIASAKVVIVLWSLRSVASNFVKEEAQLAQDSGKLLPVKIEHTDPPIGFRRVHAANLIDWRGEAQHSSWRALLSELRERLGSPSQLHRTPSSKFENGGEAARRTSLPIAAIACGALFLIGGGFFAFTQLSAGDFHDGVLDPAAPALAAIDRISAREWSALSSADLLTRVFAQSSKASLDAAARSDPRAQSVVGLAHFEGMIGYSQNDDEAVRFFELAAAQGYAGGQVGLGGMYASGRGVLRDDAEAARLFREAANQGDADGQALLGVMYKVGNGVGQSDAQAVRLFQLAADQGHAPGQTQLGMMYLEGRGVARNETEALRLFRLAADQGYAGGQVMLGGMFQTGTGGVQQNWAEAAVYYRMAASQGDAAGQFLLGNAYEAGLGVAQDRDEAVQLYQLAARQGDLGAQRALRRLGESW